MAELELGRRGWEELRAFRDDLRQPVGGARGDAPSPPDAASMADTAAVPLTAMPTVALSMQWDEAGQVHALPRGSGWRKVASLVTIEVFKAQQDGSWSRLKTCRNPRCAVAFFDRSRNNSGVWHNVKVCGNAANLRAFRARQRVPDTGV
ncbi:CGNR zinc finger domain-containing protein [Streptomyces sp. NPDC051286]|uniref:CGNR zinc finger domain-containing protein n=1 Tax=Streptomyces sp. NPDC051286 TaxID=3365647 RepID=UPI0037B2185E